VSLHGDQQIAGLREKHSPELSPSTATVSRRLAEAIRDARLEPIARSGAFTQEDQPVRLAEPIRSFVRETPLGAAARGETAAQPQLATEEEEDPLCTRGVPRRDNGK
jgi:hypothetical protein